MNQLNTLLTPSTNTAANSSASDSVFGKRRDLNASDAGSSFESSLDQAQTDRPDKAAARRDSDRRETPGTRPEPASAKSPESTDADPADASTVADPSTPSASADVNADATEDSFEPVDTDPDATPDAAEPLSEQVALDTPFDIQFSINGLTFNAAFTPIDEAPSDLEFPGDPLASHAFTLPPGFGLFGDQTSLLTVSLNAGPALSPLQNIETAPVLLPGQAPATATSSTTTTLNPAGELAAGLPAPTLETQADTQQQQSGADGSGFASHTTGTSSITHATTASALSPSAFADALAATSPAESNAPTPTPGTANPAAPSAAGAASPLLGSEEPDTDALNAARLNRGLNSAVNQKGGNVTLRLTPPELGTVRIQLNVQGTSVTAQFHAETESARTLLTQQLAQLKGNLESQGLSVEKIGVQSMSAPTASNNANQQQSTSQHQQSQPDADPDGRSRGQHQQSSQQQSGSRDPEAAEEDRARNNLSTARALFNDLLAEDPAAA